MAEEKTAVEKNEKDKPQQKGGCFKGCFTLILLFVIFGALIGACFGDDEASTDQEAGEKKEVSTEASKKEGPSKEEELAKQKEYFTANTQPAIDEWTKVYDSLWNDGWKPTFEAISNGSRDVYTAYANMKTLEEGYGTLSVSRSIPTEGLSKDHQKAVEEGMRQLAHAATARQMAAEKAMKMFDEGNLSPSQMDKITADVTAADSYLMDGVIKITTVKSELGLIEEENTN